MPQPVFRTWGQGTFNAATITVPYPAGTIAGDLVIVYLNVQDSLAVYNIPAGWTTATPIIPHSVKIADAYWPPTYQTAPYWCMIGYLDNPTDPNSYYYKTYPGLGLVSNTPRPGTMLLADPTRGGALNTYFPEQQTDTVQPPLVPAFYWNQGVLNNCLSAYNGDYADFANTRSGRLTAYYKISGGESSVQFSIGAVCHGQYIAMVIAAGTYNVSTPIDNGTTCGSAFVVDGGAPSPLGASIATQIIPYSIPHANGLTLYAVSSGTSGWNPQFSGWRWMYGPGPNQPVYTADGQLFIGQGDNNGPIQAPPDGISAWTSSCPPLELAISLSVRGNDSVGAQVAQFYVSAAYSTEAQFHVAQQAIEVAALPVSNAMLVQQAVEVLHTVGVVRYHTTDTYSVNRYTVGGGDPTAVPAIPPTTTDALIYQTVSYSHTTDTALYASSGVSYVGHAGSGDLSAPGVLPSPPHTIDSYSVWSFVVGGTDQRPGHPTNNTPSTTDALLYQTAGYSYIAKTGFSTPQLLKAPYQTTNALLYAEAGVSYVAHAGSGNLSAPGVLPAPKHTIDCLLHYTSGISKDPATGVVVPDAYHTTDIIAKGSNYRQHDSDALLLAIQTQQHDTSALIYHPWRLPHTTNAWLRATRDIGHSTDAKIGLSNSVLHTADAHVVQYNIPQRMTTDTSIIGRPIVKHRTDARLKRLVAVGHALDTYVMHTGRLAHSTDATTWGTMSTLHTADALIYTANVHSHTTDTSTAPFQLRRHTTDAMVRRTTVLVHTITANLIQPVLPGVIPSYRFTYQDDYGQTYTSIYKITGTAPYDILDITTIIEQPYVWGANDAGYVQARNLYRRGIITTQRQVLQGQDNGYIIIVDELQPDHYQWIDNILTSFNCYDVPVDPFKYHLGASINDTVDLPATQGVRFTDLDDVAVVWGQIAQDGTVSIPTTDVVVNPNGTINDFPVLMEWMDVWSEPRVTVPWRVYMGTSLRTVLTQSNFAELFPVQLFYNALVTYQFAGGGYKYICFPTSFPAPIAFLDPLHKIAGQHVNVVMANASDNPAYHNLENDYPYAVLTMTLPGGLSTDYRIYRTKYPIGGPLTIQLSG